MAIQEEYLRLISEIRGVESIEELKRKLNELAEVQQNLEHVSGKASGGTRNLGFAALEASRAIEDLQYGFNGVVNNIPGLVMALGGTAGLTAVISLVSVGVNQLINHWDDLVKLFGGSASTFDTAKTNLDNLKLAIEANDKELKSLKETQLTTNEQVERYNTLTETAERLTRERTRAEEEARARQKEREAEEGKPEVSQAVKRGMELLTGSQVVQARIGVIGARQGELEPLRARLRAAQARLAAHPGEGGPLDPEGSRLKFEYDEALRDLNIAEARIGAEARTTVGLAQQGEVPAFRQLQAAAAAAPERFEGVSDILRLASPEEARAQRESNQDAERQRKANQERIKDERERRRKTAFWAREALRFGYETYEGAGKALKQEERNEAEQHRDMERTRKEKEQRQRREENLRLRQERAADRAGLADIEEATSAIGLMTQQLQAQMEATKRMVGSHTTVQEIQLRQLEYMKMVNQQAAWAVHAGNRIREEQRRAIEDARTEQMIGAFPQ